jgi:4-amino-4-deoxy-L-arabinose transferase-like glycosyltransferase
VPGVSTEHALATDERSHRRWWGLALGAVLLLALSLRVWGVASGLPYVYNTDEDQHFVPHAVGLLGHLLNPNYFDNPPAYTYLLAAVYSVWFGGRDAVSHALATNPTEVWVLARLTAGVLGTLAVGLLYLIGTRLFDRRTGLLAAGLMAVSFLPVFYSKLALNDVPTLVPVEVCLWAAAGVLRFGRKRDYVIAGIALGVAAATKYTGGIVAIPLAVACLMRAREERNARGTLIRATSTAGLALLAFLVADPYALIDLAAFKSSLAHQGNESAGSSGKLGLTHGSGVLYYLWTVTWGIGWIPGFAALAGVVVLWFKKRRVLAMFVPALVLYLLFMGIQGRYFGRWLMPIVPLICLLAAYAGLCGADALARGRRRPQLALVAFVVIALCGQGFVYSVHAGIVDSRADTRNLTRGWLVAHVPLDTPVVVEPVVPEEWGLDVGHPLATATGYRWPGIAVLRTQVAADGKLQLDAGPNVTVENYERVLQPGLIGLYERNDFCWVVTGSTQSGRASVDPQAVPQAIAYYQALARDGRLVYESSPYGAGSHGVAFNFDWAFDYYPLAYTRPGAVMKVYRLNGGRCAQR